MWIPDREALAWAAGFWDGEGCAVLQNTQPKRPRDYLTARLSITQHNDRRVLDRFQHAVAGVGNINGPYLFPSTSSQSLRYCWQTNRPDEALTVAAMLWPFLSPVKQDQLAHVLGMWLTDARGRRKWRRKSSPMS